MIHSLRQSFYNTFGRSDSYLTSKVRRWVAVDPEGYLYRSELLVELGTPYGSASRPESQDDKRECPQREFPDENLAPDVVTTKERLQAQGINAG
jgi:hypothetical protein